MATFKPEVAGTEHAAEGPATAAADHEDNDETFIITDIASDPIAAGTPN